MQDLKHLLALYDHALGGPVPTPTEEHMEHVRECHRDCVPFYQDVLKYAFETMLDIAAGTGMDTQFFADHGKVVTAMDLYPQHMANDLYPVTGDMHDMPFTDGMFDCVLSKHVLEHTLLPMLIVPPGSASALEGHLVPGWNIEQLEYLLAVSGFDPILSRMNGWNVATLARRAEESYRSTYFSELGAWKTNG